MTTTTILQTSSTLPPQAPLDETKAHPQPTTQSPSPSPSQPPSAVLYPHLTSPPPIAISGNGCWITTSTGQRILDASGGAAVACIGHGDRRIEEAITRQLREGIAYVYAPFFTNGPVEELTRVLCESTGGEMERCFVVSSGTEAIEAALKLSRQYFLELPTPQPQRTHFIARHQSYHGNTLGALSLGGHKGRKAPYTDLLSTNVSHVSPCYAYRYQGEGESDEMYVERLAKELDDEFQRIGPGRVCAFVAETVSGSTLGCVPALPGYFAAMQRICHNHGALLILDEVMSGIGRTGTLHAWEQENVIPDLQTVAKGLGAGYLPIGAMMVSKKVVEALGGGSKVFVHSQTYQGHAVASAAAVEVQRIIREDGLLGNVRERGEMLEKSLKDRIGGHKHVGDIRGRGLFWGLEFVCNKETKEPFPVKFAVAATVHKTALMKYGVSCIPSSGGADGKLGDTVQLAPPYIVTEEEIGMIVERMAMAIEDVFGSMDFGEA